MRLQKNAFVILLVTAFTFVGCKTRETNTAVLYSEAEQEKDLEELTKKLVELGKLIKANVPEEKQAQLKADIYKKVVTLNSENKIKPLMRKLLAKETLDRFEGVPEALKKMSNEKKEAVIAQLSDAVDAQLTMFGEKGRLQNEFPMSPDFEYFPWEDAKKPNDMKRIFANLVPFKAKTGAIPGTQDFVSEISGLLKATFSSASYAMPLFNGPASFKEKYNLIKNAKSSIWIASWAFGNEKDFTAGYTAEQLVKKAREEDVDVRVMVDGQTAIRQYGYWINWMIEQNKKEENPNKQVKIVRWRHPEFPYFGNHRKFMIVDGKDLILGGMNFGDEYSHAYKPGNNGKPGRSMEPAEFWRDTDIHVRGRVVDQAISLFAKVWNEAQNFIPRLKKQDDSIPDSERVMPLSEAMTSAISDDKLHPNQNAGGGKQQVLIVDNNPPSLGLDPIYLLTLKMILSARSTIDISNAYYIASKPIQDALIAAIDAGVIVRVHTNSKDSVDVGDLVKPIYKGLNKIFRTDKGNGARIYLQKTSTLHSKYMIVDRSFGWVGSYNLHPRSLRYEGETILVFSNAKDPGGEATGVSYQMEEQFEKDIDPSKADRVTQDSQIAVLRNVITDFSENFFFDQL